MDSHATAGALGLIVIADDYPDCLEALSTLLTWKGYEVACASDGQEALRLIQTLRPAGVLLDLGMPILSGWQVVESLRADPRFVKTFIAAVTGYSDDATRRRATAMRFDAFFTKPVDFDRLFTALSLIKNR